MGTIFLLIAFVAVFWLARRSFKWIESSKEALMATFVMSELNKVFIHVITEEGKEVFREKEWARYLLKRLIEAEKRFADTNPRIDREASIGRLIRLAIETAPSDHSSFEFTDA